MILRYCSQNPNIKHKSCSVCQIMSSPSMLHSESVFMSLKIVFYIFLSETNFNVVDYLPTEFIQPLTFT